MAENWAFIYFKKYSKDKKKMTRQRRTLDIEKFDIYPAEGHKSVTAQIGDKWLTVCVGGSCFAQCSTWESVNNLMVYV